MIVVFLGTAVWWHLLLWTLNRFLEKRFVKHFISFPRNIQKSGKLVDTSKSRLQHESPDWNPLLFSSQPCGELNIPLVFCRSSFTYGEIQVKTRTGSLILGGLGTTFQSFGKPEEWPPDGIFLRKGPSENYSAYNKSFISVHSKLPFHFYLTTSNGKVWNVHQW